MFKRMFGASTRPTPAAEAEQASSPITAQPFMAQPQTDETRLAARRAQIANDLFELQQIAMAELELRKEQDAAAAKAGFEAEDQDPGARVLLV